MSTNILKDIDLIKQSNLSTADKKALIEFMYERFRIFALEELER